MMWLPILMVLTYFAGMAYVVYSHPLPKIDLDEVTVAGRSFGWLFMTMTIVGTWYGGVMYVGFTQMAIDNGVVASYVAFYTLGGLFFLYLIGGRYWKVGKRYNVRTQGQFFELRYRSRPLRVFVALCTVIIEFPWIVAELLATGYVIYALTRGVVPVTAGVILVGAFFIAYVTFAGARAVIIADFYQGWMWIFGGVLLVICGVYYYFGGFLPMFATILEKRPESLALPGLGWDPLPGPLFWVSLIISGSVGAYCWPSLFARIMAASSSRELKKTSLVTPFIVVVYGLLIIWLAVGFGTFPEEVLGDDHQYSFLKIISAMGPAAIAIISVLILNGALSMCDSMVSSWGSVVVNDVFSLALPSWDSRRLGRLVLIMNFIVGCLGVIVATLPLPTIIELVMVMYQGIIQIFPLLILGIFWKRGTAVAAWGGLLSGLAVTGYYSFTAPFYIPQFAGLQAGLLGLIVNFAVYLILALAFPAPKDIDEVFATMTMKDADILSEPGLEVQNA
ncbi:MAG: sodium:solute symporter family protein [Bacillota bacterium]|jgi:SSS family solute:Na+ symporter